MSATPSRRLMAAVRTVRVLARCLPDPAPPLRLRAFTHPSSSMAVAVLVLYGPPKLPTLQTLLAWSIISCADLHARNTECYGVSYDTGQNICWLKGSAISQYTYQTKANTIAAMIGTCTYWTTSSTSREFEFEAGSSHSVGSRSTLRS